LSKVGWYRTLVIGGIVALLEALCLAGIIDKITMPAPHIIVRDLWRKNLVQIQRVTALERDAARLEGERGSLVSSIAQTKGKITETELQALQIDQDLRTEVGKELAEIRRKIAELVERKVAAEDQLKRIDIRAPQDGMVHQSSVHTVGASSRRARRSC